MESLEKQLKKGVLDVLLLKLLGEQPRYGYDLLSTLETRSGGAFALKEGTLYPILYRLEDAGHIASAWESDAERRGVPRKYYAITDPGREHLRLATAELKRWMAGILQVMEGNGQVQHEY